MSVGKGWLELSELIGCMMPSLGKISVVILIHEAGARSEASVRATDLVESAEFELDGNEEPSKARL